MKNRIRKLEQALIGEGHFVHADDTGAIPAIVLPNGDYQLFWLNFSEGTPPQWPGRYAKYRGPEIPFEWLLQHEDERTITQLWLDAFQRMQQQGAIYET